MQSTEYASIGTPGVKGTSFKVSLDRDYWASLILMDFPYKEGDTVKSTRKDYGEVISTGFGNEIVVLWYTGRSEKIALSDFRYVINTRLANNFTTWVDIPNYWAENFYKLPKDEQTNS